MSQTEERLTDEEFDEGFGDWNAPPELLDEARRARAAEANILAQARELIAAKAAESALWTGPGEELTDARVDAAERRYQAAWAGLEALTKEQPADAG